MATESSSKRLKNDDGIDRINTLPDSLLCHILSFLPTKTSVCTTTLVCRQWRYLWKNLQTFYFSDNYEYNSEIDHKNIEQFMFFTIFVNTVLSRRESRDIQKFTLDCSFPHGDNFFIHSMETWIRTAIGPHLQEFNLGLFCFDYEHLFNLPLPLLSCSNLVFLRLFGYILLQLQDSSRICLPSLKVLQIQDMFNLDFNSVNILLSGCPILETLEISFFPGTFARLRVPSCLLKRVEITVENDLGASVEIDVPGPKYLSLNNIAYFRNAAPVRNLHNVEEAYLDAYATPRNEIGESLLNLLRDLSRIKHLELHSSITKLLFDAPVLDIPEFCNLFHLEVFLPSFNIAFLFNMLKKCPMLQTLIIHQSKDRFKYGSSPEYGWQVKPPSVSECLASPSFVWLVKPKRVPKCLVSHLTFIHFKEYQGNRHELEFIRYVLDNGFVLETMLIDEIYLLDQPKEWVKLISNLPRESAMCNLKLC